MITTILLAQPKDKFQFSMQADKTTAYVGEPVKITFLFKYPIDIQIAEANFAPPTFHDFWIKAGKDVPTTVKDGYHIYRLDYSVTPQKAGVLEIEPARMDIGILKSKQRNTLRFDRVTWKSIFSNGLKIDVKALPDDITLYGNYQIHTTVDKNRTKANEPVNLTVTITGEGNMEDIDDFTISSDKAAVYADKAKRSTQFQKGLRKTVFTQKFAFIADQNFTIPPLSLTYFNSTTKKVTTIKSDPIPIYITNQSKGFHTAKLEKRVSSSFTQSSEGGKNNLWIAALIGGFIAGILLTILWTKRKTLKEIKQKQQPIQLKLKKARDDKTLLALLLPYKGKSEKLDQIIYKLEANLYEEAKFKIDRKDLHKNFDKYVTIKEHEAEILL
jgi:hypothetical protein